MLAQPPPPGQPRAGVENLSKLRQVTFRAYNVSWRKWGWKRPVTQAGTGDIRSGHDKMTYNSIVFWPHPHENGDASSGVGGWREAHALAFVGG